jgi:hypothetical protein
MYTWRPWLAVQDAACISIGDSGRQRRCLHRPGRLGGLAASFGCLRRRRSTRSLFSQPARVTREDRRLAYRKARPPREECQSLLLHATRNQVGVSKYAAADRSQGRERESHVDSLWPRQARVMISRIPHVGSSGRNLSFPSLVRFFHVYFTCELGQWLEIACTSILPYSILISVLVCKLLSACTGHNGGMDTIYVWIQPSRVIDMTLMCFVGPTWLRDLTCTFSTRNSTQMITPGLRKYHST